MTSDPRPIELAPRFPVLDALRAVGALAVLTTHVAFYTGDYSDNGTWGGFLARLDVGVALFFVLSGFLLSRPYLARAALGMAHPATGHYLWKRALRILPVYIVAVVLALALLDANADLGVRDWLVTLAMLNTFVDPQLPAGLTQMWSLAVEATFYLALPVLMLAATGRRPRGDSPAAVSADGRGGLDARRVLLLATAMVVVTVWWHLDGAARTDALTDAYSLQWLPAYLSWFAVGIGLALAHVVQQSARPARWSTRILALGEQPGVCWVLVAGLMLVATTPLAGPTLFYPATGAETLTKNLLYAAIGGLVVLTGLHPPAGSGYRAVLGSAPARHLGLTSYSLFCLHLLVLDLLAPALGWDLFGGHFAELWVLTVVVSLLVSEVAYRVVERPAMRLKRRFPLRSLRPTTKSAASGTSGR